MDADIWNIEGWLESAQSILSKLYGLPGGVLVLLSCIAVGYVLRLWKWFPDKAIPVVAIIWGPIFNTLLADPKSDDLPLRVWICKNVLVGLLIGVIAWVVHNKVIARFEDKIPFLGKQLAKMDEQPKPTEP